MAEFMEGYGVKESRRGRWIKRVVLTSLAVLILGTASYFYFRTWGAERAFDRFMQTLDAKNYEDGYRMWCTAKKPCPYYPIDKFKEDWDASKPYGSRAAATVRNIDYCGEGVVFDLAYADAEPIALWVDRASGVISFYPHQRCPGKRLQFGPFFRRLFGGAEKGRG